MFVWHYFFLEWNLTSVYALFYLDMRCSIAHISILCPVLYFYKPKDNNITLQYQLLCCFF